MTAFEVEGSGSSGAQRWLNVLLLKDGDAAGRSATIVLDEDDEVSSVACDRVLPFREIRPDGDVRQDGRGDGARRALPVIGGR